jgi:PAS domain S-box-containing protein
VRNENGLVLERIYSACRPGCTPSPELIRQNDVPYIFEKLMMGEAVILSTPEDLPPEAEPDKQFLRLGEIQGLVLTASDCGTTRKGILGVAYIPTEIQWTEELIAQLGVINNLIVNSVERKSVYDLLHESEKRFRYLVQNAPIGVALEDVDGNLLFVNPAICSMIEYSESELRKMHCSEFSDPEGDKEEAPLFQKLRNGELSKYTIEKQFIRKDGIRIWGRVGVALMRDESSDTPFVIAMVEDITERKLAEQELQRTRLELEQLAGYLIQTQDDERHRISRELHDDIGQRLSLLAVEFDLLSQSLAAVGNENERQQVSQLKSQADALTSDVHQLSHQLHSAKLQHLGLRSAVEELVKQVGKQHRIAIELQTQGGDADLPPDVALCLFRVTQEALNNVIRHSRAERVHIDLNVGNAVVRLSVQDSGVGFDVANNASGLGLVSMRERLRMIGGDFIVESQLGQGTEISATVPLTAAVNNAVA